MAFRSVGINLPGLSLEGVSGLADDLEALEIAGQTCSQCLRHMAEARPKESG
jgi:hypothetical protein